MALGNGSEFHFIFIVDRSGSMGGDRIEVAKEALDLFIRSLPNGCKFSVISFGCNWDALQPSIADYTDHACKEALAAIKTFSSNYGGTEILAPLREAQTSQEFASGLKKRIFLLTDGSVNAP